MTDAYPSSLDELSGSYVEERHCGRKLCVELSFRQLSDYCAKQMSEMDRLKPETRARIQIANDPNYRPIRIIEEKRA